MASLTEVYEGGNGVGLRRLHVGVALFAVGALLVIAGLVLASTDVGATYFGLDLMESREAAGTLGGVGFPALLIGTMTVLPKASRRVRTAAGLGALGCLVGVAMFRYWYPDDWVGTVTGNPEMTVVVTGTYFAGAIITTWCLFVAVANFKARNDPGGTVTLEITKGGRTRIVEVSNDNLRSHLGGIGLLGGTPDGAVETQTNQGQARSGTATSSGSDGAEVTRSSGRGSGRSGGASRGGGQSVTDGGATTDDAEFLTDEPAEPLGDVYCGNCTHFQYVRTGDGLVPYCGHHGEEMDDMDACDEWTANTGA